ncbi:hypothetical protein DHEL01_v208606 [Diaporthe helianthi]|uniref:Uncharacterized protein n=1 Tax=Diaporthe helianthi TaxID=158607 RepID=A0A2P5HRW9_DIAHE|nr:hypothetical protein DHEL01_v208606 [Diaporthe helianthi]
MGRPELMFGFTKGFTKDKSHYSSVLETLSDGSGGGGSSVDGNTGHRIRASQAIGELSRADPPLHLRGAESRTLL